MSQNINEYLAKAGFNVDVGEFENNPFSQKRAVMDALKTHTIGTDWKGNKVNVDDAQSKNFYNTLFDKEGNQTGSVRSAQKAKTYMDNDFKRSQGFVPTTADRIKGGVLGSNVSSAGERGGYGFGWTGNRMNSRVQQFKSIGDTVGLAREGMLNSLGIASAQQRAQFKASGLLGKGMAIAGPAIGGLAIMDTMLDGGDMYDTMSTNLTAAAVLPGFHFGKSIAGSMFGGAKQISKGGVAALQGGKLRLGAQLVLGSMGAATGMALVGGATFAARDLTSSESILAKAAMQYSSLSMTASTESNNATLTMRGRALQQLSQSSLNDRGSLLGNEAAILKNLM